MSNKTFEQKLVLREQGLQRKKEGHVRVIMKETGASREFLGELKGSARLGPMYTLFQSDLVTYYVDTYLSQRLQAAPTSRTHKSGIKGRSFTLNHEIKYSVTSAKKIVTNIDKDPLQLIESEIVNVLSKTVQGFDWEELLDDQTDLSHKALSAETPNGSANLWTYLRQFADALGIELIEVSIDRVLSEEAMSLLNIQAKSDLDIETKKIQVTQDIASQEWEAKRILNEHDTAKLTVKVQSELERIKASNDTKVGMQNSVGEVLEKSISKCNSIPQVMQVVRDFRQHTELGNYMSTNEGNPNTYSSGQASPMLEQRLSDDPQELLSMDTFSHLLVRLEASVESINDESLQRKLVFTGLYLLSIMQLGMEKPTQWHELVDELAADVRMKSQALTGSGDYLFLSQLIELFKEYREGGL